MGIANTDAACRAGPREAKGMVGVPWPLLFAATAAVWCCSLAAVALAGPPAPGELQLRIELHPAGGLGVLGEPIVALSWITNPTKEDLWTVVPRHPPVVFTVQAEPGPAVPPPPPPLVGPGVSMMMPGLRVEAGQTSGPHVSIVETAGLDRPGTCTVTGTVWVAGDPARLHTGEGWTKAAESAVEYELRQGTAAEYEWMASLFALWAIPHHRPDRSEAQRPAVWMRAELASRIHALASQMLLALRRDEALPHLAQMCIHTPQPGHFEAIGRIGTPRARDVLELLATSQRPEVAERAAAELARLLEAAGDTGPQ